LRPPASRRSLILVAFFFLTSLAACRREADVFPNAPVVLICVDTLRADHLPAYGYKGVETPALDALARDSIVFENAVSQVPLTLPSHASLLTGLLPFQDGVRDNVGYRLEKSRTTLASLLKGRGYATGAAVSAFVLDHTTGISSGFDFYDDRVEASRAGQAIGEVQRPGLETERILERWVSELPGGKPFFAFLHLYEPHSPYTPPEPFSGRYAARPYDGEIAAADDAVGKFLAFLKAKGRYDGSLVVFLSDHGEGLGDHGEDEHGIFLYREAVRVPLFVKLPGSHSAARDGRTAALVDVFPTVAAAAGVKPPEGLPGSSLLSRNGREDSRRVYSETLYPRFHLGWSDLASLTDRRFQYIHAPRPEIYDWTADPGEKNDLARGVPDALRAMRAELDRMERPFTEPGSADPETVKKLAALGYISVTSQAAGKNLPDPKDRIGALAALKESSRLSAEGRYEEAAAVLRKLAAESPGMLDAKEALARVLRQAGRPAEAFDALLEADRMAPGRSQVVVGLADLAMEKGDLARARTYAQAASAIGASGAREVSIQVELASGHAEEARRLAKECLAADERSRRCRLLLAQAEKQAGSLDASWNALEELKRASEKEVAPPIKDEEFLRGDVLARLGRESEAEEAFRREIQSFPENPRGWTGLALLYASQGKGGETRRILEEMTVKSRRPDVWFAAAHTWEVLGDRAAAAAVRSRAGTVFPGARDQAPATR